MIDITQQQKALMKKHLELVIEANKNVNLTRIDSIDSGMLLHIEDSLVGLKALDKAPTGEFTDLGTGGGYPGIPLSICTGRKALLVESKRKKTDILNGMISELHLEKQIATYTGRIEDLSIEKKNEFSVVVARALTSLPSLLELSSPLLKKGGWLISYKSAHSEDEFNQACSIERKLGMKYLETQKSTLSDGETNRVIYIFQKVSEPSMHLPRKSGTAQKSPFK